MQEFINDVLAKQRTHLANERTILAYSRTSLSLLAAGFVMTKFISTKSAVFWGGAVMILGVGLFVFGVSRFVIYKKKINKVNGKDK